MQPHSKQVIPAFNRVAIKYSKHSFSPGNLSKNSNKSMPMNHLISGNKSNGQKNDSLSAKC
jgi:hypothetical protein